MAWNIVYAAINPAVYTIPPSGALGITGYAPVLENGIVITPKTGSLTMSTAGASRSLVPQAGSLGLTGYMPTISTQNESLNLTPGTGSLSLTGNTPSISIGGASGTLAIITNPTLNTYQNYYVSLTLRTVMGTAPYTYAVTSGSLPAGLTLNGTTGNISGWNTSTGSTNFTVTVTDSTTPVAKSGTLAMTVNATATGGSLAYSGATTLPNAANGEAYFFSLLSGITGGSPPYNLKFVSTSGSNGWRCDSAYDFCVLQCCPTTNGTETIDVEIYDTGGATPISVTLTVTTNSTLKISGISNDASYGTLPQAMVGNKYGAGSVGPAHLCFGGSGSGYSWSQSGAPTGLSLSTAGVWTGTPSGTPGTYTITVSVTDSASNTATSTWKQVLAANQNISPPSWASGKFCFVSGGQLYDSSGAAFRGRGADQQNIDSGGDQGSFNYANASMVRTFDSAYYVGWSAVNSYTASHVSAGRFCILTQAGDSVTNGSSSESGVIGISTGSGLYEGGLGSMCNQYIEDFLPIVSSATMAGIGVNFNEWGSSAITATEFQGAYSYLEVGVSSVSGTTITLNSNASTHPFTNAAALAFIYLVGVPGITNGMYQISTTPGGTQGAWTLTAASSIGTSTGSGGNCFGGVLGNLRAYGYYGPLFIDCPGGEEASIPLETCVAIFDSDPYANVVFTVHMYSLYTGICCGITGLNKANPVTVDFYAPPTLCAGGTTTSQGGTYNPFSYNGESNPTGPFFIEGAGGMTQINGQTGAWNGGGEGGTAPNFTVPIQINTSSYSTYTSGGQIIDTLNPKAFVPMLAGYANQYGIPWAITEFGPASPPGSGIVGTMMTSANVITNCDANGLHWTIWAMDGTTGPSNYNLVQEPGTAMTSPSAASYDGLSVLFNPHWGLRAGCTFAPALL